MGKERQAQRQPEAEVEKDEVVRIDAKTREALKSSSNSSMNGGKVRRRRNSSSGSSQQSVVEVPVLDDLGIDGASGGGGNSGILRQLTQGSKATHTDLRDIDEEGGSDSAHRGMLLAQSRTAECFVGSTFELTLASVNIVYGTCVIIEVSLGLPTGSFDVVVARVFQVLLMLLLVFFVMEDCLRLFAFGLSYIHKWANAGEFAIVGLALALQIASVVEVFSPDETEQGREANGLTVLLSVCKLLVILFRFRKLQDILQMRALREKALPGQHEAVTAPERVLDLFRAIRRKYPLTVKEAQEVNWASFLIASRKLYTGIVDHADGHNEKLFEGLDEDTTSWLLATYSRVQQEQDGFASGQSPPPTPRQFGSDALSSAAGNTSDLSQRRFDLTSPTASSTGSRGTFFATGMNHRRTPSRGSRRSDHTAAGDSLPRLSGVESLELRPSDLALPTRLDLNIKQASLHPVEDVGENHVESMLPGASKATVAATAAAAVAAAASVRGASRKDRPEPLNTATTATTSGADTGGSIPGEKGVFDPLSPSSDKSPPSGDGPGAGESTTEAVSNSPPNTTLGRHRSGSEVGTLESDRDLFLEALLREAYTGPNGRRTHANKKQRSLRSFETDPTEENKVSSDPDTEQMPRTRPSLLAQQEQAELPQSSSATLVSAGSDDDGELKVDAGVDKGKEEEEDFEDHEDDDNLVEDVIGQRRLRGESLNSAGGQAMASPVASLYPPPPRFSNLGSEVAGGSATHQHARTCSSASSGMEEPVHHHRAEPTMSLLTEHMHLQSAAWTDAELDRFNDSLDEWDFDVFEADKMAAERPLSFVTFGVLRKNHIFEHYPLLKEETMATMITAIENGYHVDNPYHNRIHAADVVQTTHYFMTHTILRSAISVQDVFCAIIAASIHDFQHPGTSNSFLVATQDKLAVRYNDRAVLEHMHVAAAFQLMRAKNCDVVHCVGNAERYLEARETVIQMVLATDMSHHFDGLERFKTEVIQFFEGMGHNTASSIDSLSSSASVAKGAPAGTGAMEEGTELGPAVDDAILDASAIPLNVRRTLLKTTLHCADVSNPAKKPKLCQHWAKLVQEEFFRQGDKEREAGLKISMFMDRTKPAFHKCQVGFITIIVKPLFASYCQFLTSLKPQVDWCLSANLNHWEKRQAEEELNGGPGAYARSVASSQSSVGGSSMSAPGSATASATEAPPLLRKRSFRFSERIKNTLTRSQTTTLPSANSMSTVSSKRRQGASRQVAGAAGGGVTGVVGGQHQQNRSVDLSSITPNTQSDLNGAVPPKPPAPLTRAKTDASIKLTGSY